MVHLHNGIVHSRKELLPFATAWMKLESIMLSEIGQVVKNKYHYDLTFNRNLINKMNKQANITKDTEIENRLTVARGERGGNFRGKG